MAIDFAQMLLQPTKTSAWDLAPTGAGNAREQLKLAREKFEFDKKRAEEEDRLARERQAAEMAKARLEVEATKAAKLQEDRLKVYGEFTKASGEGNIEAMRSMVPMLHSLGMDIELEGEEGGLPRYRVGMDAAAAQQAESEQLAKTSPYGEGETAEQSLSRLGAMGLGGETGSLLPPLGIRSSDEVEPGTGQTVAGRVAATYGTPGAKTPRLDPATGQPMVDEEDFTGGVPKNVIDMGAMAASTLHRLDPSLKAAAAAFPDEQTSAAAEQIRLGLRASGLPLEKQQAAFDKAISGPASQRNAQIAADAQAERFRETRDELTPKDIAGLEEQGRAENDKFAAANSVPKIADAFRAGDTILRVIDDPSPDNDAMIASELMTFQGVKGTPSDTDLKLAFGIPLSSLMDQAWTTIRQMVAGGMQAPQRNAIKAYMKAKKEELKQAAFDFLEQSSARANGGAFNEHTKRAYLANAKTAVPGWIYNDWLDMKKARDEGPGGDKGKSARGGQHDPEAVGSDLAEMSDFDLELEGQALESDLDPEKIRRIIGPESGGDPKAVSTEGASGVLQIMPSNLRKMGIDPEKYRKLSAAEQLPAVMQFLKAQGLTSDSSPEDYAMAVAASDKKFRAKGASDDMVVYPKGSAGWKANKPWRPDDDGDITRGSILRFYGLRGGQKGKGDAKTAEPAGKSPLDKKVLDILRKGGG
jgi:hypothetical protein